MRAAFVADDVLSGVSEPARELRRLEEAFIQPIVLMKGAGADVHDAELLGYPHVSCPAHDPTCLGEQPESLVRAAAAVDATLSGAFLVCSCSKDLALATTAGCRRVLVVGDRSLSDLIGYREPDDKGFAAAPDLATAVGYMIQEAQQEAALGPFPYGPHRPLEERSAAPVMTRGDLVKVMTVVVAAGLAISLGIAYLLQEIYQTYTFPPVAYWLTLQFIPQTLRGLLFLLLGAAGTLIAQRILKRVTQPHSAP